MHMADALVAPAVAATMYVCSGGVAGFSVKKVRLESDPKKSPVMGVMGAFVFAAQMINFTIPGTGSSGHLCGGMMLTALLGPYAAFLTMIGVLLIQCLLFADGGLAYIAIHEDGSWKSSFSKFMTEEQMEALIKAMDGQAGDLLLFAADRNKIVWNVLGALRLELAEQMGLLDKNEYRFVWITEFPLLEWSDEENRFTAMHHPFTMPMDEDLPLLDTDPGAVRAKAYDIVLNGTEIGGGSVRIHQNDVQEKMFEMLGFTKEQAHERFGFLLDAFKYGVPPHAGLAYGLDRLVMLMAKEDSIRDVIAFPKVKDASCLMTEAPSPVDAVQLEELGLEVEPQAEEETTEE